MMVCGFPHSMAHRKFPCVAWIIIMDKMDKPCLLQATGRPFKSRDLALSREVNRQGQRNRAVIICDMRVNKVMFSSVQYG